MPLFCVTLCAQLGFTHKLSGNIEGDTALVSYFLSVSLSVPFYYYTMGMFCKLILSDKESRRLPPEGQWVPVLTTVVCYCATTAFWELRGDTLPLIKKHIVTLLPPQQQCHHPL